MSLAHRHDHWASAGLAVAGLLGAGLVLLATARYGAAVTSDSIAYIAAARHVGAGEGFIGTYGGWYVAWPPMLPGLLALLGMCGVEPAVGARWLNALAFGATVALVGHWVRRTTVTRGLWLFATVLTLLSFPLLLVACYVWSEPLFVLLAVAGLYRLSVAGEDPRASTLLGAALLVAAACLTRYFGVTLIMVGGLMLLVRGGASYRRRVANAALFGVVTATPLALWLARNWWLTGHLTGPRASSEYTLLANVTTAARFLAAAFVPAHRAMTLPPAPVLVVLALSVVGVLALHRRAGRGSAGPRAVYLVLGFAAVYAGCLVVAASRTAADALSHRLLAPLYVPGVLLAVWGIDAAAQLARRAIADGRWGRAVRVAHVLAVLAGCAVLAEMGDRAADKVRTSRREGAGGYCTTRWQESATIAHLRGQPNRDPLVSNSAEFVYLQTDRPVALSPVACSAGRDVSATSLAALAERIAATGGAELVWFTDPDRTDLVELDRLAAQFTLECRARLADGAIYHVSPPAVARQSQP
ncbi:MAG: hypothetical protein PVJ57_04885 [Phycisphaerae bacterium]|jgi:hypothetical protein